LKILTIILLLITLNYAKSKDFYYSFIDSNGKQISKTTKDNIVDSLNNIEKVKDLMKDGKVDEAFQQISELREKNKISLLDPDILLLYCQIVLKNSSKKLLLDASNDLEYAINHSGINQENLLDAYLLLVDLKRRVNKIEDAKYYSQTIINVFDDEEAKIKGKIEVAKIYKYQKNYHNASKILFEVLANTKSKQLASIVGNELFDIYLLEGKKDEAKELMKQILLASPSFFSKDFTEANLRVDLFLKMDMTDFAILVLKNILTSSQNQDVLEMAKLKLANVYMSLYDKEDITNKYLQLAKRLYKNVMDNNPKAESFGIAEQYYDEIRMRLREILPNTVAEKYPENENMQQRALLQELINYNIQKEYAKAIAMEKAYKNVPKAILKRFGYTSIEEILDISYKEAIKGYIEKNECSLLSSVLKNTKYEIFKEILENDKLKEGLIQCIGEVPSLENYTQLKNILAGKKDLEMYFILEGMALLVEEIDDALYFSSKIERSKNMELLKKEFLIKYQVLKIKNDPVKLDSFFKSALENSSLIEANKENPIMVDFYYDFYLYLQKNQNIEEAFVALQELNKMQNEMKIYVYSPFAQSELAKEAKEKGDYNLAIEALLQALNGTRNIKASDEIKLYYDLSSLYEDLNNKEKQKEFLQKCIDVKIEDSMYKKLCESKKNEFR